jgi:ADP-ribosylglycohydrolase
MGQRESLPQYGGLASADVSCALQLLATGQLAEREAALRKLRAHFVRQLGVEEKTAAVARVDAERYEPWAARPASASALAEVELADRIRGLVFGAALGDAVGLATEFLSRDQVKEYYGDGFEYAPKPAKIWPDTHRLMWLPGDWTDDTDQLVLVLQSLLHNGGRANPPDFARRLTAWRHKGFAELGDESAAGLGQHTKRVIATKGFLDDPIATAQAASPSAANGAVMRTAITGVPFFWSPDVVRSNTRDFCLSTHADPRCLASCTVVAGCVSALLRGETDIEALIAEAVAAVNTEELASCTVVAGCATALLRGETDAKAVIAEAVAAVDTEELQKAASVAELRDLALDDPHAIGYTYKCLSAGLWGLRSRAGLAETICAVVAEGGDADTNAAVAGALHGCRVGFSELPAEWVAQLEHRGWLEAHVQKLLFMLGLR